MKFGSVDNPGNIDFTLPPDDQDPSGRVRNGHDRGRTRGYFHR